LELKRQADSLMVQQLLAGAEARVLAWTAGVPWICNGGPWARERGGLQRSIDDMSA
jgi:hypothetical protein